MQIERLKSLKKSLYSILRINPKQVFLTVKEIREIMRNGDDIPTTMFSADKKEYIAKPRTIYSKNKAKRLIKF